MLKILGLAVLLAALPSALSAQPKKSKPEPWQVEQSRLPKRPPPATSCAHYGAGFVKLAGSETCVRIGADVEVGVGTSTGR